MGGRLLPSRSERRLFNAQDKAAKRSGGEGGVGQSDVKETDETNQQNRKRQIARRR